MTIKSTISVILIYVLVFSFIIWNEKIIKFDNKDKSNSNSDQEEEQEEQEEENQSIKSIHISRLKSTDRVTWDEE
jgi:hypothetical protein